MVRPRTSKTRFFSNSPLPPHFTLSCRTQAAKINLALAPKISLDSLCSPPLFRFASPTSGYLAALSQPRHRCCICPALSAQAGSSRTAGGGSNSTATNYSYLLESVVSCCFRAAHLLSDKMNQKFGGGRKPTGTPSLAWSSVVVVISLLAGASVVHNFFKPDLTLPPLDDTKTDGGATQGGKQS
ncbi:hypothetical protein M9H77_04807 [Catharanthus roseus]|uniref:Uncharacterized protein n=1 Tax=Catharanthus roseus TaxID=4058 RepID=A0ACC0CFK5_CATRO|nr:hypothetical protein M9H77_04807 [Catharanthus roseus]